MDTVICFILGVLLGTPFGLFIGAVLVAAIDNKNNFNK